MTETKKPQEVVTEMTAAEKAKLEKQAKRKN
jgi:hypothetical protein